MPKAPLYAKIAQAPNGGQARWINASDGVRLRMAWWPKGDKGTILIFQGRTEFVEKYGRVVAEFQRRGYAVLTFDWRGQGLSDRLTSNRMLGHVGRFADYQLDVAAVLAARIGLDLPEPLYLCAHSMGGAIGYRALAGGLPVKRSVLTAPMFGMMIDPLLRPIVLAVAAGTQSIGLGEEFAPGTSAVSFIESKPFEGNSLTSDAGSFAYIAELVRAHPGLSIGGPSVHWIYEALFETRELARLDAPKAETLCFLGSDETVVDKRDVVAMIDRWPGAQLEMLSGARHEILMETAQIQTRFFEAADLFFQTGTA